MIQSCIHCGFINGNADEHTIFCPNCGEPYPALNDMTVQVPQMAPRDGTSVASPFAPYGTSPYAQPYSADRGSGVVPPPPPGLRGTRPPARRSMGGFVGGMLLGLGLLLLLGTVLAAAALTRNGGNGVVAQVATATPSPTHARPTATVSPTVTPVPLVSYQDPSQRFSVRYPANWSATVSTTNSDGEFPAYLTTFRDAGASSMLFDVLVTPQRLNSGSLKSFVQNGGGTNFQQSGGTTNATIAGSDWRVVTGTFTSVNGVPLTAQMLYTRRDNITTYAMFLIARQDQFTALSQKTFTPMVQSFAFGSNPA